MKLGVARFGVYSNLLKALLESQGITVIMPTKITREMIRWGVANSSDMQCFPYKAVLGQQIWALEQGATDLIMFNNCGLCRQKHYYQLEEHALRKLGYSFNMHVISRQNFKKQIKGLFHLSFLKAYNMFKGLYGEIKRLEEKAYSFSPGRDLKVGLVGEVYTCWEPDINFDIVRKLQHRGANVHMSITVTDFLKHETARKEDEREAKQLLTQELGGHGFQSICNTIFYGKNGYDGVIHLMPLSCMPESTVETLVDSVAERYGIPLYRFPIDESNFERGFDTRLETFVSMLRRRKR